MLDQVSPGAAELATGLSQLFNAGLSGVLTQLSALSRHQHRAPRRL